MFILILFLPFVNDLPIFLFLPLLLLFFLIQIRIQKPFRQTVRPDIRSRFFWRKPLASVNLLFLTNRSFHIMQNQP